MRTRARRVAVMGWIQWIVGLVVGGVTTTAATAADPFAETVRPLVQEFCADCHGADAPEGDIDLLQYKSLDAARDARPVWLKALGQLSAQSMPPEDAEPLSASQRAALIEAIDRAVNTVDCDKPVSPGRVTLRRLNRHEYRFTVKDLLGVDFAGADAFPGDDVGYGFDNVGDVMSLPPLLMEKYLAAAEAISRQAVVTPRWPPELQRQLNGSELRGDGQPVGDRNRVLTSHGATYAEIRFPAAGRYEISVQVCGDQAGPEPVKLGVELDERPLTMAVTKADRKGSETIRCFPAVREGKHKISVRFLNDFYQPDGRGGGDRNLYVKQIDVRGPLDLPPGELTAPHQQLMVALPDDRHSVDEAARAILQRLATRAYRRPVTSEELDRLTDLVRLVDAAGDSFERGIQVAVQAILVSPSFLFRIEQDPAPDREVRWLNDFELATRLSYFLWCSLPDEELMRLAAAGRLRQDSVVREQVQRMLRDPKTRRFVERFADQWLQLDSLEDLTFDQQRFPGCDSELLAAMKQETEQFFGSIVEQDASVMMLLDADYTFVNERLANHYGLPGVRGPEFRRVSLADTPRRGLLTHGSFLAVTSNPTRTSPVKRGKFILENLLAEPPPPPPANVPLLDDQKQLTGTLRERLEQHRRDPTCAACHRIMDPLGFALEHFDAVGRWREADEGQPIDTTGKLPTGEQIDSPQQLAKLLLTRRRDAYLRCIIEKTMVFALGRGIEYYDQCAIDRVARGLEQGNFRFSQLIAGIALSEPFRKRAQKRSRT